MEYLPYVWLAIGVFAVFVESMSPALVSIWFVPGALISMILAFVEIPLWIQTVVFFSVSALCLIFFRPIIEGSRRKNKDLKTNVDALIGKTGIITEDVDNIQGLGAVKVNGLIWSARSQSDSEKLCTDDLVEIVSISGVKLICRKK